MRKIMFTLTTRKQNSIIDLGSKVLNDKDMDHEFRIISNEMMQYRSNENRNFDQAGGEFKKK